MCYFGHAFIIDKETAMPRPRKCRRVAQAPVHRFYKPQGVPLHEIVGTNLSVEGLEALRLADAEGLEHEKAAELMGISRPTFSRILTEARQTVATALSKGWAIHIQGGDFEIIERPPEPDRGWGRGRRGRRAGCILPKQE
jgi:predicted DNA-binding protein (UPF0251 family)